jgi:hypothetical protein
MALQKLFDCGGPPQTGGSSGRKKEYQAGSFRGFVEGLFKRREIPGCERGERFLTWRRGRIHPEVRREKNKDYYDNADREGFLLHFADPEK